MDPQCILNDAISRRDTATFHTALPDRFDGAYRSEIHPILLTIFYNNREFLEAMLAKEVDWGTILTSGLRLFSIVVVAITTRNSLDLFSLVIADMSRRGQLAPFIDEAYNFVTLLLSIRDVREYLRVLVEHDKVMGENYRVARGLLEI